MLKVFPLTSVLANTPVHTTYWVDMAVENTIRWLKAWNSLSECYLLFYVYVPFMVQIWEKKKKKRTDVTDVTTFACCERKPLPKLERETDKLWAEAHIIVSVSSENQFLSLGSVQAVKFPTKSLNKFIEKCYIMKLKFMNTCKSI